MDKVKTVAFVSLITCVVLAAGMVGIYLNFTAVMQQQSTVIKEQGAQIDTYKNVTDGLKSQLGELRSKVNQYSSIIDTLDGTVANLMKDMVYFQLPN